MKRLFALVAAIVAVGYFAAPAMAQQRTIIYPAENPSSVERNTQQRFLRLAFGTWISNALGTNLGNGIYAGACVVPNGGMNVAVQPCTANTLGSFYQLGADDTNPIPVGQTPQLAADATQIVLMGTQSGTSGSVGPMTAPGSGLSQYYLLEVQLKPTDGTPLPMVFVDSHGNQSTVTVNTQRADAPAYQLKAGTPPASPTVPTADSGWFGIATVLVPSGTGTITSGMISMLPAFAGFVENGTNVTVSGLTISSQGAGCLQTSSSGQVSAQPCTSGLGTVNGTAPVVASTSGSVATVSCPTCVTSVTGGTGISVSGASQTPAVALSHGDYLDQSSTAQTKSGALTTGALTSTGNIAAGSASGTQVAIGPQAVLQSTGSTSTNNALNVGFAGTNSGTINWYPNGLSNGAKGSLTSAGAFSATTGAFSGTVTTGALTAAGVNVGGALTDATTATFSGQVGIAGAVDLVGSSTLSNADPYISNDGAGVRGININVPTGSTFGLRMLTNGASSGFQVTASGALTASSLTASGSVNGNNSSLGYGAAFQAGSSGAPTPGGRVLSWGAVSPANVISLGTNTGISVSGVVASAMYLYNESGSPVSGIAAFNQGGDLGIGGALYAAGNVTATGGAVTIGTTGNAATDSANLYLGNNQGGSGKAFIVTHDSTLVSGVAGSVLSFGQAGVANLVSVDASGDEGIAGALHAGSAVYGPTISVPASGGASFATFGSAGTAMLYGLQIANAVHTFTNLSTHNDVVAGVHGSLLEIGDTGVAGYASFDNSGNLGLAGGLTATTSVSGNFGTWGLNGAQAAFIPCSSCTSGAYVANAANSAAIWSWDNSGNITAPSYNLSSRREWKNVVASPLLADPLAAVTSPWAKVYAWCYNGKGGTVAESAADGACHLGPMVNHAPTPIARIATADDPRRGIVKGEKIAIDESALTGLTLAAVQQLSAKVDAIERRGAVSLQPVYVPKVVPVPAQDGPTLARLAAKVDALAYDNRVLRERVARMQHARERVSPKRKSSCPKGWKPMKRGKRVVGCTNATPSPRRREAVKR